MERPTLKKMADFSVYLIVRFAICFIQAISLQACQGFARVLSWIAVDLCRFRNRVLEENLLQAFPDSTAVERKHLKREMWEHLVLMICEIAHAPRKIHETNWYRYLSIPQRNRLVDRLLEDRPLVMVSGHFGNFEIAGFTAGLLGFPTYAIARELDNPYVHRFLDDFRRVKGQYMISKDGSANEVKEHLDQRRTLLLLADQHAGAKGCWIEFFGRAASYHKAVAVFTLTADAPLVVCSVRRSSGPLKFVLEMDGEVDPRDMPAELRGIEPLTQWYNDRLEAIVRRTPGQYWWLHRRWKGEPPKKARAKSAQNRSSANQQAA